MCVTIKQTALNYASVNKIIDNKGSNSYTHASNPTNKHLGLLL